MWRGFLILLSGNDPVFAQQRRVLLCTLVGPLFERSRDVPVRRKRLPNAIDLYEASLEMARSAQHTRRQLRGTLGLGIATVSACLVSVEYHRRDK